MQLITKTRHTSRIRTEQDLLNYSDGALVMKFHEIIPMIGEEAMLRMMAPDRGTSPLVYAGDEIYHRWMISTEDKFFQHVNRKLRECTPKPDDDLSEMYVVSGYLDRLLGSAPPITGVRYYRLGRILGDDLHFGRTMQANLHIFKYWLVVALVKDLAGPVLKPLVKPFKYLLPVEAVTTDAGPIPSLETIAPCTDFEEFRRQYMEDLKCFGLNPDAARTLEIEIRAEYERTISTRLFRLNEDAEAAIHAFIMDHCDEHLLHVRIDNFNIRIERGVCGKTLPYYQQLFERNTSAPVHHLSLDL